jgi:hypothetical protein
MQLLQKLLQKLNGLHYTQEYLCLAKESFQDPLHAYLVHDEKVINDVTNLHLFTGYSPLIFTLASSSFNGDEPLTIKIAFSQHSFQPNDFFKKRDALAMLSLRLVKRQAIDGNGVCYYEGTKGEHHFLSFFHQFMISLNNRFYNKKAGNVFLRENLYKQVQIAYSIPRIISLITVADGNLYNLFPTDLHGPVNDRYYVSSLRRGGKAYTQVEHAGKIVISEVHSDIYKTVYTLGKNHMQELKSKENFFFSKSLSKVFSLPLPRCVLYYRELELIEAFDYGIHKFLLYKIVSAVPVNEAQSTLAHIHNSYATWRKRKGLAGNYLLR